MKLAFTIEEAIAAGAGCRSEIYKALKDKRLKARKRGHRTVILAADLERFLEELPDFDTSPDAIKARKQAHAERTAEADAARQENA